MLSIYNYKQTSMAGSVKNLMLEMVNVNNNTANVILALRRAATEQIAAPGRAALERAQQAPVQPPAQPAVQPPRPPAAQPPPLVKTEPQPPPQKKGKVVNSSAIFDLTEDTEEEKNVTEKELLDEFNLYVIFSGITLKRKIEAYEKGYMYDTEEELKKHKDLEADLRRYARKNKLLSLDKDEGDIKDVPCFYTRNKFCASLHISIFFNRYLECFFLTGRMVFFNPFIFPVPYESKTELKKEMENVRFEKYIEKYESEKSWEYGSLFNATIVLQLLLLAHKFYPHAFFKYVYGEPPDREFVYHLKNKTRFLGFVASVDVPAGFREKNPKFHHVVLCVHDRQTNQVRVYDPLIKNSELKITEVLIKPWCDSHLKEIDIKDYTIHFVQDVPQQGYVHEYQADVPSNNSALYLYLFTMNFMRAMEIDYRNNTHFDKNKPEILDNEIVANIGSELPAFPTFVKEKDYLAAIEFNGGNLTSDLVTFYRTLMDNEGKPQKYIYPQFVKMTLHMGFKYVKRLLNK